MAGVVVEILLKLALDDAALLLDDEDLLLVAHEGERAAPGERPDHADLVDVDAEAAAGGLVEAEEAERLHQVEVALAGGDEAEAGLRDAVEGAVDGVGLGEGPGGVLLRLHALLDLRAGEVGPAIVEAAGVHRQVGEDEAAVGGELDGLARFDGLGDGLEADPHAGEAGEGVAVFAEARGIPRRWRGSAWA